MNQPFETAINVNPDNIGRGMRGFLADPLFYSDLILPQKRVHVAHTTFGFVTSSGDVLVDNASNALTGAQ